MPMLAIPAIIRGLVPHDLVNVTLMGAGVFVLLAGVGAWCFARTAPLRWIGGRSSACATGCAAGAEPMTELPSRLLRERDRILQTLGTHWKRALLATVGRWTFDYLTLLAALAAVGSRHAPHSCCSRSAPRSCWPRSR